MHSAKHLISFSTLALSLLASASSHAEIYNCNGTYYDGSPMKIIVNSDNNTIKINGNISLNITYEEHSNGSNHYTSNSFTLPDNKQAYIMVEDKQDNSTVMHIYDANTRTELYVDQLDCG